MKRLIDGEDPQFKTLCDHTKFVSERANKMKDKRSASTLKEARAALLQRHKLQNGGASPSVTFVAALSDLRRAFESEGLLP